LNQEIQAMLKTSSVALRDRAPRGPRVSELQVWRAAAQLRRQYPQNPWLEAAHRADRAYAAGHMFHFRLWGRVTHALRGRQGSLAAAA
jgi:hypothetical protein